MIPYDDLVIALATWRARQGLPVAQLSGALTPPPVMSPPARTAPPAPAPRAPAAAPGRAAVPPPLAAPDMGDDVDAAALLEDGHYESVGDDFAVAFGNLAGEPAESTAIGSPPPSAPKGRGRSDW